LICNPCIEIEFEGVCSAKILFELVGFDELEKRRGVCFVFDEFYLFGREGIEKLGDHLPKGPKDPWRIHHEGFPHPLFVFVPSSSLPPLDVGWIMV